MWHDVACLCQDLRVQRSGADEEAAALADGYVWTLLPRHGRRPLRFLSRGMLRVDNRAGARAGTVTHWSDIRIYEISTGGFVTAVCHRRTGDDHAVFHDAWIAETAREVVDGLRAHDTCAVLPICEALCPSVPSQAWQNLIGSVFAPDTWP